MNKTGIEWCDYTWNPVTGCKHGCPYCYARKIAERFKGSKAWPQGFDPMFHPERLDDPVKMKKPQTIFVCSMADLFGDWVPAWWIWDTFAAMDAAPQHTYIMLTKNPERMKRFAPQKGDLPRGVKENWWFGTSVTCQIDTVRIKPLLEMDGNRFISFEPLIRDPGPLDLIDTWKGPLIKQVIIGAQTNPFYPVQVSWIKTIEDAADRAGAKVFVKDSLKEWMGDSPLFRRELCWSVHKEPTGVKDIKESG